MNEEKPTQISEQDLVSEESGDAFDIIQDTFEDFFDAANVNSVYGPPVKDGDTVIVPAAEVFAVVGFGVGSGYGTSSNREGEEGSGVDEGGGGGGGGGGRVLSRPAAVIISSPEGVRVEPVIDLTKIALAALTAAGFMASMLMRMKRPKKTLLDS